jgi:hypothetical protein
MALIEGITAGSTEGLAPITDTGIPLTPTGIQLTSTDIHVGGTMAGNQTGTG